MRRSPARTHTRPDEIYPAVHYTMGGLWVDYNLMSNIPGLHVLGEANFSDHGANRLGASALMQGLADGYFVIPATIANYLATRSPARSPLEHPAFEEAEEEVRERIRSSSQSRANRTVDSFHRELGLLMLGQMRHGAHQRRPRRGARAHPADPRRILEQCSYPGHCGHRSTWSWRKQAGSPIFSSSAS